MFALVEPWYMRDLADRPHLGCAMLLAACAAEGIPATLVQGQTRFLQDFFEEDADELWDVLQDLEESDLDSLNVRKLASEIEEKGLGPFKTRLRELYRDVVVKKSPQEFFNGTKVRELLGIKRKFEAVHLHHLQRRGGRDLSLLTRYVDAVLASSPRYAGFSMENRFDPLTRAIRKKLKTLTGLPIIVGGALTPFIDLDGLDKTLEEECIDYLIIGPGEHALPALLDALEGNREPEGIPNLFYKRNGRVRGSNLEIIKDLDALALPDFSQFDLDRYLTPRTILPVQTARGCTWRKCAFCSHYSIYDRHFKVFSIERVLETFLTLERTYGCSLFALHDDELTPARAGRISQSILDSGMRDLSIYTYARLVKGFDDEHLLSRMRRAGFTTLAWGMESGSQRVLDLMQKGTDVKLMGRILQKSKAQGMTNTCFVFFGFPGETRKDAEETVAFLKSHKDHIDDILFDTFKLSPFSPIGKEPERWGVTLTGDGDYQVQEGMTRSEATDFYRKFATELGLNSIHCTSDRLKYMIAGSNRRMLNFLISAHGLVPASHAVRMIREDRFGELVPIITGTVVDEGGRPLWHPVKLQETAFINQMRPVKQRVLNEIEHRLIRLSDGTRTLEEILALLMQEHSGEAVRDPCKAFLVDAYENDLALAFSRVWA